jgi:thioredoxin reductase (NADPH)
LYKNKDVVFIGAGISSIEEALYGKDIINSITILNNGDGENISPTLLNKISNVDNITIINDANIIDILGEERIDSVQVKINDEIKNIPTVAVFSYIGFTSDLVPFENLKLNTKESLIVTDDNMMTNNIGIFAIGDIRYKKLKQISIAVSDGTIAALNAINLIDG